MRKLIIAIAATATMSLFASPAVAEPGGLMGAFVDHYDCTDPKNNDCIADRTPNQDGKTTVGDAISAGWMGNTANPRPSGHGVLPSLSPGSKTFGKFVSAVRSQ